MTSITKRRYINSHRQTTSSSPDLDPLAQKNKHILKNLFIPDNSDYADIFQQVLEESNNDQDEGGDGRSGRKMRKRIVRLPSASILKQTEESIIMKLRYKGTLLNNRKINSSETHSTRSRSGTPSVRLRIPRSATNHHLHNNGKNSSRMKTKRALPIDQLRLREDELVIQDMDDIVVSLSESESSSDSEEDYYLPYRGAVPAHLVSNSLSHSTSEEKLQYKKSLRFAESLQHEHTVEFLKTTRGGDDIEEFKHLPALKYIHIRNHLVETWYVAPLPSKFNNLPVLYLCEMCLRGCESKNALKRHERLCKATCPPGDEIYREGGNSIFEVDGLKENVFCRNLCLLAKLFLNSKTLFYDVDSFLFYLLTEYDPVNDKHHIVGYFSKEKANGSNYNLSCILTLPVYQRRGYGNLLIDFSYLLSRIEFKAGTPEKPLSELGALSYRNYWKVQMAYTLRKLAKKKPMISCLTVVQLSKLTGMVESDVIVGLEQCQSLVRNFTNGSYSILYNRPVINQVITNWESKNYTRLNPSKLIWKPVLLGASIGVKQPINAGKEPGQDFILENIQELNEFVLGTYEKFEQFGEGLEGIADVEGLIDDDKTAESELEYMMLTPDLGSKSSSSSLDDILQDVWNRITDDVVESLSNNTPCPAITNTSSPSSPAVDAQSESFESQYSTPVGKLSTQTSPMKEPPPPAAAAAAVLEESLETATISQATETPPTTGSTNISTLTTMANGTDTLMEALIAGQHQQGQEQQPSSSTIVNTQPLINAIQPSARSVQDPTDTDLSSREKHLLLLQNLEFCFPGMELNYRLPSASSVRKNTKTSTGKRKVISILDDDEEDEGGEEKTAPKKKRGRGRPRKVDTKPRSSSVVESNDGDDSYNEVEYEEEEEEDEEEEEEEEEEFEEQDDDSDSDSDSDFEEEEPTTTERNDIIEPLKNSKSKTCTKPPVPPASQTPTTTTIQPSSSISISFPSTVPADLSKYFKRSPRINPTRPHRVKRKAAPNYPVDRINTTLDNNDNNDNDNKGEGHDDVEELEIREIVPKSTRDNDNQQQYNRRKELPVQDEEDDDDVLLISPADYNSVKTVEQPVISHPPKPSCSLDISGAAKMHGVNIEPQPKQQQEKVQEKKEVTNGGHCFFNEANQSYALNSW